MQNYSKLNKIFSIHGLDIGNSACKTNSGVIFDSRMTQIEPLTERDKFVFRGEAYWLGEGILDTTYRKIDKENYLKFVYASLALSTKTTHNNICLGLPLGQFKDKEGLIELIMNNNREIVEINNRERSIIIDKVDVMPEGISTLDDDEECIIVDIGGLTTDTAFVINDRGVRRVENPISIPTGTINLYTDFINKINSKYRLSLKMEQAPRILKQGLLLDGEPQDIDFALDTYKEYTEQLLSQLRVNYDVRTNYISLTGGGSILLHNNLKERLGQGVRLQEDPVFANAKNFYELGCSLWEDEYNE